MVNSLGLAAGDAVGFGGPAAEDEIGRLEPQPRVTKLGTVLWRDVLVVIAAGVDGLPIVETPRSARSPPRAIVALDHERSEATGIHTSGVEPKGPRPKLETARGPVAVAERSELPRRRRRT